VLVPEPWVFSENDLLYDVAGRPPVLSIGSNGLGDEAVVTWLGDDRYELDVALAGGGTIHRLGHFENPHAAQATAGDLAAAATQ
jgi:hypothetical protein